MSSNPWQRVHLAFKDPAFREFLRLAIPEVWVDGSALRAGRSMKVTHYQSHNFTDSRVFTFEVDGEVSPPLAGEALAVWLCVKWPELFRMSKP